MGEFYIFKRRLSEGDNPPKAGIHVKELCETLRSLARRAVGAIPTERPEWAAAHIIEDLLLQPIDPEDDVVRPQVGKCYYVRLPGHEDVCTRAVVQLTNRTVLLGTPGHPHPAIYDPLSKRYETRVVTFLEEARMPDVE